MKKFLVLLVIVAVGVVFYLKVLKPVKPEVAQPPPPPAPPSTPAEPQEPPITTDGVNLFKEGKYKDAIRQLEKELNERAPSEQPSVLNYLAQAYEKTSNQSKAIETWQKLVADYPSNQFCGNGYYALGKNETDPARQMEYYEKAVEKYPQSDGAKLSALDLGESYLQSPTLSDVEKQAKARHCFTIALKGNLTKEKREALKQKLNLINRNLVFSPTINPSDSISYKIKPGENIWKISDTYKVPPGSDTEGQVYLGQIRRINYLKTSNIRAGDKIKIITGKFSVDVDKSNFTLTLYLNNDFVKEYPIAVGEPKESPTPEGTFHILGASKTVNPPWHRYDKTTGKTTVIPFGDSAHSIGTRWMGFKDNEKIGIHGTNTPDSIGKAVTNGCIRMYNADVEELFDLISNGTEVNIHE